MNKISFFLLSTTLALSPTFFSNKAFAWEAYNPTGRSEIVSRSLEEALQYLGGQFIGEYSKTTYYNDKENTEIKTASITLEKKVDQDGFSQPAITIQDGDNTRHLYVSNIESLKGVFLESDLHIILSYREMVPSPMPYASVSFYDFLIKEDLPSTAEALLALSRQWQKEKDHPSLAIPRNDANMPPAPKYSRHISLSIKEQEKICNSIPVTGKKVSFLYQNTFLNCTPLPMEFKVDLSSKVKDHSLLLVCGNATLPSAKNCPALVPDPGNEGLSFRRALVGGSLAEEQLSDKKITVLLYANGTRLNSRSAEIYLIEEDTVTEEKVVKR